MIKAIVGAKGINDFVDQLNALGLTAGQLDIETNESGHYYALYDSVDATSEIIGQPEGGAVGFSWASGSGTLEVMQKSTPVTGEVVTVISDREPSGTLASGYVLPGTLVLTDSGGTGPTIRDGGDGILYVGTRRVGTVDYRTKAVELTYHDPNVGTGNLEAAYSHSDIPDSANMPERCVLKGISLAAGSSPVTVTIYEDEAKTVPVWSGSVTVVGGVGYEPIDTPSIIAEIADWTKRDRRWVVVGAAVTDLRLYWEKV